MQDLSIVTEAKVCVFDLHDRSLRQTSVGDSLMQATSIFDRDNLYRTIKLVSPVFDEFYDRNSRCSIFLKILAEKKLL